jgi:hypothetical protein
MYNDDDTLKVTVTTIHKIRNSLLTFDFFYVSAFLTSVSEFCSLLLPVITVR